MSRGGLPVSLLWSFPVRGVDGGRSVPGGQLIPGLGTRQGVGVGREGPVSLAISVPTRPGESSFMMLGVLRTGTWRVLNFARSFKYAL